MGLLSFSACDASPPTANLERWFTLPENSVGREHRQSNFAGQARHCEALVDAYGRGSLQGKRPTVRRAEQVTRSKGARMTLAWRLVARQLAGRDACRTWLCKPLVACRGRFGALREDRHCCAYKAE